MNENNVKIQIHEVNNTSPAGLPTDSTDIAFIPGFAKSIGDDYAYDTPVLITTVKDFETAFGAEPYTLTSNDVKDYGYLQFVAGDTDRSYVYAKELLYAGMPVVYAAMERPASGSCLDLIYSSDKKVNKINRFYDELLVDKGNYSVKYITSGGYPSIVNKNLPAPVVPTPPAEGEDTESSESTSSTPATTSKTRSTSVESEPTTTFTNVFGSNMITCAETRGDAVALIDYQLDNITSVSDFYEDIHAVAKDSSYGAMMYPWAHYSLTGLSDVTMPASYAYLNCVARAIKTSPNWYAMAGVSRGLVNNIKTLCTDTEIVTNSMAEHMQPKYGTTDNGKNTLSVNCITNIKPYGLCIWGNRTMKTVNGAGCEALNFLNTRNMLSDIKKVLFTTSKYLMFEQNSDTLWLRFKAGISPLLNQLKLGNGISDFKIIKSNIRYDKTPCGKGELAAIIRIYPIHAVEYFDLTVDIRDDDVVVEGE